MPKYRVFAQRLVNYEFTVEADSLESAEEKVSEDLPGDVDESEDVMEDGIYYNPLEVTGAVKLCNVCERPEDEDGNCGCTN